MDEVSKKSEPRVLQYRGVRWAGAFAKWSAILFFGLGLLGLLIIGLAYSTTAYSAQDLLGSIFFSIMFGSIFLAQYWWWLRPLMLARIRVFSDRIDIQRGDQHEQILFEDIKTVKLSISMFYVKNRFTLVMKNGKSFRFAPGLERSEYLIEGLYQCRPDLIPPEKYQKLRDSCVLADHKITRFYTFFHGKNVIFSCLQFFVVPVLCALGVYLMQAQRLVIHSPGFYMGRFMFDGIFLSTLIHLIGMRFIDSRVNKTVQQRLRINPQDKRRDLIAETRWLHRLFPIEIALTIGIFFLIGKYDLNKIDSFTSSLPSPNLNIAAHEIFWVDERYNCVECKYSLKKGDLLSVRGQWLPMGVVALPGETILVNLFFGDQHEVVAREVVIPPTKIAVQAWEMGRPLTALFNISQVKGLLTRNFPSEIRPPAVTLGPSLTWLPPPQHGLVLVEGCEPSALTSVRNIVQQFTHSSEALFKTGKYPEILVNAHSVADAILQQTKACSGIVFCSCDKSSVRGKI